MVKRIFLKDQYILAIIVGVSFIVQLAYLNIAGIHLGGDSEFYLQGASYTVRAHYPFYYLAYPFLLGVFHSKIVIVYLQITLHVLSAVLIYKIGQKIFNTRSGIIAAALYASSFEIFQWNTYILTDSLFVSSIVFLTYCTLYSRSLSIGLTFATLLLRPTALPLLASAFILHTWHLGRYKKISLYAISISIIIGSIIYALTQHTGSRLGFIGYIHYFSSLFERGIIVRDRPPFSIAPHWQAGITMTNIITFLEIVTLRLIAFWAVVIKQFSLAHNLLNIFTLFPLFLFGLIGLLKSQKRSVAFLISPIIIFWIFQCLTEVDYDWRYRLPILPFIILFAGFGASELFPKNSMLPRLVSQPIVRFLCIGTMNALLDYAVLNILYKIFDISLVWSVFWGFIAGGVIGYFLHARYTFIDSAYGKHAMKLPQYFAICIVNLGVTEILIHTLVQDIGLYYNAAKFAALCLTALISYLVSRYIIFPKATSAVV